MERVSPEDASGHDTRAWFLATCPDPQLRDARRAIQLAKRATALAPRERSFWVTLGAAHYRAGNWQDAVDALGKAQQRPETSSWRLFFLAMVHGQLGHKDRARECYDRAVGLMDRNHPADRELRRLCAEAQEVLGIRVRKSRSPP
jgi:uncharacterized protein HemY